MALARHSWKSFSQRPRWRQGGKRICRQVAFASTTYPRREKAPIPNFIGSTRKLPSLTCTTMRIPSKGLRRAVILLLYCCQVALPRLPCCKLALLAPHYHCTAWLPSCTIRCRMSSSCFLLQHEAFYNGLKKLELLDEYSMHVSRVCDFSSKTIDNNQIISNSHTFLVTMTMHFAATLAPEEFNDILVSGLMLFVPQHQSNRDEPLLVVKGFASDAIQWIKCPMGSSVVYAKRARATAKAKAHALAGGSRKPRTHRSKKAPKAQAKRTSRGASPPAKKAARCSWSCCCCCYSR